MKCKNCGKEFTEKYSKHSNGDFCSKKCARGFSTKEKRKEINEKVSDLMKGKLYSTNPIKKGFDKRRHKFNKDDLKKAVNKKKEKRKIYLEKTPTEKLCKTAIRSKVIKEQNEKCLKCGNTLWLGKPIILEIHHIDGNTQNNKRENLEALCLNCHAQTETWRKSKNPKNHHSNKDYIEALKSSKNIKEALKKLKIKESGGNYLRAQNILDKMLLEN